MISAEALSELVGFDVAGLEPVTRGGNSRVFKMIDAGGGAYAAKFYPPVDEIGRDRLATEWTALTFLAEHGITCVPRPISRHEDARLALYGWIDGESVTDGADADIAAMLDFIVRLKELRAVTGARTLPPASEACFSLEDIAGQISRRLERYRGVASPELQAFLADEVMPLFATLGALARQCDGSLRHRYRTLSPSDFGLHNAVRRADGTVAFVDFEYFGWDDPVKLISDILWHPAMRLSLGSRAHVIEDARSAFADDDDFARRLRTLYPWFGLRWCMILLSEFLPERWSIRAHAGRKESRDSVLPRQLALARNYLERVREAYESREDDGRNPTF